MKIPHAVTGKYELDDIIQTVQVKVRPELWPSNWDDMDLPMRMSTIDGIIRRGSTTCPDCLGMGILRGGSVCEYCQGNLEVELEIPSEARLIDYRVKVH